MPSPSINFYFFFTILTWFSLITSKGLSDEVSRTRSQIEIQKFLKNNYNTVE